MNTNISDARGDLEYVILVDSDDAPVGRAEKLEAHQQGLLHRACSVVLFNSRGEMLLQQRNPAKYHSGGLWSNACCTHPRPNEAALDAAVRRIREEMGLDVELQPLFEFIYRAEFANGLIEYEYDHVFGGTTTAVPVPNLDEVVDWRWAALEEIEEDLRDDRARYSCWFPVLIEHLGKRDGNG